jgi:hypothetical protein
MNDKRSHKTVEELSAYLDGESTKAGEIKRRLDADPDATRLAEEFAALSKQLGRLPAPEVHPAFRTRVMAHVRETRRMPLLSWPWRAFAAMVVIAPVAAAIYTLWLSPPETPQRVEQRALVLYLLEQEEDAVLDQLAELYAGEAVNEWAAASGSASLDEFDETVWLDVLAMDDTFMEWADAVANESWDAAAETMTDTELREFRRLVLEGSNGDTTI